MGTKAYERGDLTSACNGIYIYTANKPFSALYSLRAHQNQLFLLFLFSYVSFLEPLFTSIFGFYICCTCCWESLWWHGQWHFDVLQPGRIARTGEGYPCPVCRAGAVTQQLSLLQSQKLEPFLFKLKLKLHVIQEVQATRSSLRWLDAVQRKLIKLTHQFFFSPITQNSGTKCFLNSANHITTFSFGALRALIVHTFPTLNWDWETHRNNSPTYAIGGRYLWKKGTNYKYPIRSALC